MMHFFLKNDLMYRSASTLSKEKGDLGYISKIVSPPPPPGTILSFYTVAVILTCHSAQFYKPPS